MTSPVDEVPTFICPACDQLHRLPEDVAARYCAVCHWPTGDPLLAWARPELFTSRGKPAPTLPDPLPKLFTGTRTRQHRGA